MYYRCSTTGKCSLLLLVLRKTGYKYLALEHGKLHVDKDDLMMSTHCSQLDKSQKLDAVHFYHKLALDQEVFSKDDTEMILDLVLIVILNQFQIYIFMQSAPLSTSPKPLFSKYSFGLVNIIQIQYIL